MRRTTNELVAGILLLVGIGFICGFILLLGEVPDLFKPTYTITAIFPNASGLIKGSDVCLSGAVIGKVTDDPQPVLGTQEVAVKLKINQSVGIRQGTRYTIESSGVFGDEFVDVKPKIPQPGESAAPYVQDGDVIQGSRGPDMATMTKAAMPLILRANRIAAQLDDMITRLNTDVLDDASAGNLKVIVVKLRDVGTDTNSVVKNSKDLIAQYKSSDSALGALLHDKQVRGNVAAFTTNYKEHGAFFYTDDSAVPAPPAGSRPSWKSRP